MLEKALLNNRILQMCVSLVIRDLSTGLETVLFRSVEGLFLFFPSDFLGTSGGSLNVRILRNIPRPVLVALTGL
jgi:hypothetical protein